MSFNPGGGGGISGASDVVLSNPANNDALSYESATQKWKNAIVDKSRVGLGNVDNTSDANKPVSTATQTALNSRLLWRGSFAASTAYAVNDLILVSGVTLRCHTAHTSGATAPATDGNAANWDVLGGSANVSSIDSLPLAVPATVTYTGSAWPARTTVTSQAGRRVFYVGNPGGTGPADMQENDIWIQG